MTTEKQTQEQREDDLERLQKLLLGDDHSRLNLLDKRVSDFESRSSDVAEVLPNAVERIANDPVLEAELERPMLRTIRASIKRDASAFTELLFPVIGPAIRRAVADALTSLVQRINAAMEHSFSIRGMRWRLEAARTGVPFAQVILSHTMRFAVQETFLIARDTGIVLAQAHRDENLVLDEDAVAAMLTAIQSFIQDSLGMSADDPLRSAELGDRTLWVINGPEAILACIISGTPPRALRDELMALLESIHARYGERFTETGDELENDIGMRVLMQQSLREEMDEQQASGKRSKAPVYWAVAISLLIILAGWKTWQEYQKRQFESQVYDLFKNQPGYVVSSRRRQNGMLVIEGLRDPGALDPGTVLAEKGVSEDGLIFRFKPFWSLEPALALQSLRISLGLDNSTGLELDNATLIVTGVLQSDQAQRLERLPGVHPLINALDLSGTKMNAQEAVELARPQPNAQESVELARPQPNAQEAVELARLQLNAPDSVELTSSDGRIRVSGYSDIDWYVEKSALPWEFGGLEVDFEPLLGELKTRLRADAAQLDGTTFYFSRQYFLTTDSLAALDKFARQLQGLLQASAQLGIDLAITLVGGADGTGTVQQNEQISRQRAKTLRDMLVDMGVEPGQLRSELPPWNPGPEDPTQRRVTVRIAEEDR